MGGIFSVALSLELPPLRITEHPALWSPDFPPRSRPPGTETGRPSVLLPRSYYTVFAAERKPFGDDSRRKISWYSLLTVAR
jgi:hypothetical protein